MYDDEFEPYENDLETLGNNEAWEDAQAEMEQEEYTEEDAAIDDYDDPYDNYIEYGDEY